MSLKDVSQDVQKVVKHQDKLRVNSDVHWNGKLQIIEKTATLTGSRFLKQVTKERTFKLGTTEKFCVGFFAEQGATGGASKVLELRLSDGVDAGASALAVSSLIMISFTLL